jgi:hypothetical protein
MYRFFNSYTDVGAPSFVKFARLAGFTLEELESFRKHTKFDRAWRECSEIRRDYLIDMALTKRHDPSFTKYLLSLDEEGDEGLSELEMTLEVV